MPLNARNQRSFHRTLFAGANKTVTLIKRDDDQKQGTTRNLKLFCCYRGQIRKTGEPLQDDMVSAHTTTWHLPRAELDRVGVAYLNALDRIVEGTDDMGRPLPSPWWWQPESTTGIDVKLFSQHVDLECLRVDPPKS